MAEHKLVPEWMQQPNAPPGQPVPGRRWLAVLLTIGISLLLALAGLLLAFTSQITIVTQGERIASTLGIYESGARPRGALDGAWQQAQLAARGQDTWEYTAPRAEVVTIAVRLQSGAQQVEVSVYAPDRSLLPSDSSEQPGAKTFQVALPGAGVYRVHVSAPGTVPVRYEIRAQKAG